MSLWADLRKKSLGQEVRTEEKCYFLKKGTYEGSLTEEENTIFSTIHDFTGFAPFQPADILENKGDVKVYLDEECTRKLIVTLAQLEDAQHSLENEVRDLNELVGILQNSPNNDRGEIEKILNRIRRLERKIETIKGIISRLRASGEDSYPIEIVLLGYYIRKKAEIHIMMGTIKKMYPGEVPAMTGIVFAHELMHAYFDHHNHPYVEHPDCPEIEEPIAEYGMLCFMELFERANPIYKGMFDLARKHVEDKQYCLGLCHYGFGAYLFEDRADFGVDWVSLFRSVCPALIMNAPEVKTYESMITPIKYPLNERSCECKLYEALKPRRFFYSGIKSTWDSDEKEIYFTVRSIVANSLPFMRDYPRGTKVHITFHDKTYTRHFDGEATVVLDHTRFFINNELMEEYAAVFGKTDHRPFAFYEEKPSDGIHPAEWVAIEI